MERETQPQAESAVRPPARGYERAAAFVRGARWLLDPLILVCAAILVAFPFAAAISASEQPIAVASSAAWAPATASRGPRVRDVPAFTPGGAAEAALARGTVLTDYAAMRSALRSAMDALVGVRHRKALERLLVDGTAAFSYSEPAYPFRFPRLDAALDPALPQNLDARQTREANDLGALLVLAAARFPGRLPTAAPLAYSILDRARAGGACLPQLNLAFLLSTHVRPRDRATATEFRNAARDCPGDPTPLWLLGEFRSERATLFPPESTASLRAALAPARATFHSLERRFPGSVAGWSGEADADLRAGYQLVGMEPFTTRDLFRLARALYRHARALDPDPSLAAGEARADAGLGLYNQAAGLQRLAISRVPSGAPLEARLREYLEQAHRFGAAARVSPRGASRRFPNGPELFIGLGAALDNTGEDAEQALSLGSGRLLAVSLDVAPVRVEPRASSGLVDLSFIPAFRYEYGITGYDRWCPAWSRRRDLVLAGRPRAALAGLPRLFRDIRPTANGQQCELEESDVVPLLAGVAELEAGRAEAAAARLRTGKVDTEGERPIAFLDDVRQDMWRFAGRLDNARRATEQWMTVSPRSRLAFDRAGEVAFLAKNYDRAARLFAVADRLAVAKTGTWSTAEAEELLKRGTALEMAGRYEEALASLSEADDVASRVDGLAVAHGFLGDQNAAYVSYNARLQAGDTELRAGRYADARDEYEAARERDRGFYEIGPGQPLRRPEVLDNNESLVDVQLGEPAAALDAIRRAIKADPLNPIFLQNLGFAYQRLGRWDEAVAAYRAAVESDPTEFPAWNDLGVVLAKQGHLSAAASAFRHAVGVESGYALGWFNLGVADERMGLTHAIGSQGAFGRAFRADADLRGRRRAFVSDDDLYFTTLDLSKPLPPEWEFAKSEDRTPVAVAGLALALLFGLQFGRTALAPGMGRGATRWLEIGRQGLARAPAALTSTAPAVAVGATVAVFLLPLLRARDSSPTSALLLALGVLALVAMVMRARVLTARRAGVALRQRCWPPGMAVGLVAASFGLGWAPLPVAETDQAAPSVHWVGPLVTGLSALVLLALGVGLEIPATKAIGTAALVMTASLLTPIEPLDGSYVAKGPAGVAAGIALVGAAVFLLLGLA